MIGQANLNLFDGLVGDNSRLTCDSIWCIQS